MSSQLERPSSFVRDARRRQIAEIARQLFNERGTDVGIDEIAAAAGVSRSTVYNRFEDRDEILRVAFELQNDELRQSLAAVAAIVDDPVERLIACFRVLIASADENTGMYRLGLACAAGGLSVGEGVIAEVLSIAAEVADLMRAAVTEAEARGTDLRGRTAASIVAFGSRILVGLLSERINGHRHESPGVLAREAWQFLVPSEPGAGRRRTG